jgi:formylglycine-generating enzyme required for sulfatase activity
VKTFYIGRTEVNWLEWKKVRNWSTDHGYDIGNEGAGSANDHPVRDVSWYHCVKWCNARSEQAGLEPVYMVEGSVYRSGEFGGERPNQVTQNASANGYRLPTEAEWEWAAQGGVKSQGLKYSGSNDADAVAWHRDNSSGAAEKLYGNLGTWPVGQKLANELGIHDMTGNVREWCFDREVAATSRGVCWLDNADAGGSNLAFSHYFRGPSIGFRLARNYSD